MADNIRDKEIILTPPLRVPVQFSLPSSLDLKLFEERELDDNAMGAGIGTSGIVLEGGEVIDDRTAGRLPPPSNIRVVSRTLRYGTGGNYVVDIVLEGDPVDGATGYDIRRASV